MDWAKGGKLRNAPTFQTKKIEKEYTCSFTEMGRSAIGADWEGWKEGLTSGALLRPSLVY